MKRKKTSRKKIIIITTILGLAILSCSYTAAAYINKWIPFSDQDKPFVTDDQGRGVIQTKQRLKKMK